MARRNFSAQAFARRASAAESDQANSTPFAMGLTCFTAGDLSAVPEPSTYVSPSGVLFAWSSRRRKLAARKPEPKKVAAGHFVVRASGRRMSASD